MAWDLLFQTNGDMGPGLRIGKEAGGRAMRAISAICYAICILAVVSASAITILFIWIPVFDQDLCRLLLTDGVVFAAALLILSVGQAFKEGT